MSLSLFINNNPATNKQVSDTGNQVTVFLNPPIVLDDNKSYQMRLLNANIVYSMPNITTKNNTLVYNDGYVNHTITFDNGIYGIQDINKQISNSFFVLTDEPSSQFFYFEALESTSYIRLYIDHSYTIKACSNNIMTLLGFENIDFPESTPIDQKYKPQSNADWNMYTSVAKASLNPLHNILIKCDSVNGSYFNTTHSTIISVVTPDVSPYSTIIYRPVHPLRIPINIKRIDQMTITLVDQDNKDIDLGSNGGVDTPELFSVVLSIEDIKTLGVL